MKTQKIIIKILILVIVSSIFLLSCNPNKDLMLNDSGNIHSYFLPLVLGEGVYVPTETGVMGIRNVKDFGAKGNGITDDIVAINSAISNLPKRGGVVYLPPGDYAISQTLVLAGNGITLEGAGIGRLGYMWGSPPVLEGATTLKWIGENNGVLLKIGNGVSPNAGCSVKNIVLNGNNLAKNLIVTDATYYLNVDNLAGYAWQNGYAITIKHSSGINGTGEKFHVWSNLNFVNPYQNGAGLDISPAGSLNVNQISISDCNIGRSNINNSNYPSLRLGYVDHINFYRCLFMPSISAHDWSVDGGQFIRRNPYAITIQPVKDYTIFPTNITFFGSSIYGGINYVNTVPWSEKYFSALIFYPFYSADWQIIPPNGYINGNMGKLPAHMIGGFTDAGIPLR